MSCCSRSPTPTCPTRRSPSGRPARSTIGFARVLCVRITYLGELGYELYVPTEQAVHVYDRVVAAGEPLGLRHAGLQALSSLRLEKGYRDYGHDIDNTDSVLEAGLGFAVDLDKPGGFVGRDAVAVRKSAGPLSRRLLQVQTERPRAVDVPRRGRAPRRPRRSGTSAPPRTATPSAAPWAWRWSTRATSRWTSTGSTAGSWEVEVADRGIPRSRRCGRCTTRRTSASAAERVRVTFAASAQAGASPRAGAPRRVGRAGRTRRPTTGGDQP